MCLHRLLAATLFLRASYSGCVGPALPPVFARRVTSSEPSRASDAEDSTTDETKLNFTVHTPDGGCHAIALPPSATCAKLEECIRVKMGLAQPSPSFATEQEKTRPGMTPATPSVMTPARRTRFTQPGLQFFSMGSPDPLPLETDQLLGRVFAGLSEDNAEAISERGEKNDQSVEPTAVSEPHRTLFALAQPQTVGPALATVRTQALAEAERKVLLEFNAWEDIVNGEEGEAAQLVAERELAAGEMEVEKQEPDEGGEMEVEKQQPDQDEAHDAADNEEVPRTLRDNVRDRRLFLRDVLLPSLMDERSVLPLPNEVVELTVYQKDGRAIVHRGRLTGACRGLSVETSDFHGQRNLLSGSLGWNPDVLKHMQPSVSEYLGKPAYATDRGIAEFAVDWAECEEPATDRRMAEPEQTQRAPEDGLERPGTWQTLDALTFLNPHREVLWPQNLLTVKQRVAFCGTEPCGNVPAGRSKTVAVVDVAFDVVIRNAERHAMASLGTERVHTPHGFQHFEGKHGRLKFDYALRYAGLTAFGRGRWPELADFSSRYITLSGDLCRLQDWHAGAEGDNEKRMYFRNFAWAENVALTTQCKVRARDRQVIARHRSLDSSGEYGGDPALFPATAQERAERFADSEHLQDGRRARQLKNEILAERVHTSSRSTGEGDHAVLQLNFPCFSTCDRWSDAECPWDSRTQLGYSLNVVEAGRSKDGFDRYRLCEEGAHYDTQATSGCAEHDVRYLGIENELAVEVAGARFEDLLSELRAGKSDDSLGSGALGGEGAVSENGGIRHEQGEEKRAGGREVTSEPADDVNNSERKKHKHCFTTEPFWAMDRNTLEEMERPEPTVFTKIAKGTVARFSSAGGEGNGGDGADASRKKRDESCVLQ